MKGRLLLVAALLVGHCHHLLKTPEPGEPGAVSRGPGGKRWSEWAAMLDADFADRGFAEAVFIAGADVPEAEAALGMKGGYLLPKLVAARADGPRAARGKSDDLATRLASDKEQVRRGAVGMLDWPRDLIADPGSTATILARLRALPDAPPEQVAPCLRWLVRFGQPVPEEERAVLVPLLAVATFRTDAAMASALLGARDKAVLEALASALRKETDRERRIAAARALATFGSAVAPALEAIEELAKSGDDAETAGRLLAAVGQGAKETILRLSQEGHNRRDAAFIAIRLLGPDAGWAVRPLLEELRTEGNDANRLRLLAALGAIGPAAKEAEPALLERLERDRFPILLSGAARMGADPARVFKAVRRELAVPGPFPKQAVIALAAYGEALKPLLPDLLTALQRVDIGSPVGFGRRIRLREDSEAETLAGAFRRMGPWAVEAVVAKAAQPRSRLLVLVPYLGQEALPVLERELESDDGARRKRML